MKKRTFNFKVKLCLIMAIVITVTLAFSITAGAIVHSVNVTLDNGYVLQVKYAVSESQGTAKGSITSGGATSLKSYINAIEYDSNGKFYKNIEGTSGRVESTVAKNTIHSTYSFHTLNNYTMYVHSYAYGAKKKVSSDYFNVVNVGDKTFSSNLITL